MSRTPRVSQYLIAENELEAFGLRAIQAFNERDFEAALALAHPEIVAVPSRVHGASGTYRGHAGMAAWAKSMTDHALDLEILLSSIRTVDRRSQDRRDRLDGDESSLQRDQRLGHRRHINAAKLALFGDICLQGEPLAPWAALMIIRDGLVIRLRTYLTNSTMLEEIGVLAEPVTLSQLVP